MRLFRAVFLGLVLPILGGCGPTPVVEPEPVRPTLTQKPVRTTPLREGRVRVLTVAPRDPLVNAQPSFNFTLNTPEFKWREVPPITETPPFRKMPARIELSRPLLLLKETDPVNPPDTPTSSSTLNVIPRLGGLEPFESVPLPTVTLHWDKLVEDLQPERGSSKLKAMSPYCMPGHTSQNFVVYSMHDGLPLHPGVW